MNTSKALTEIISHYDFLIKGIDLKARASEDRAYGGIIRAGKGLFVESLTKRLVELASLKAKGQSEILDIRRKRIRIPLHKDYLIRIKDPKVKAFIKKHLHNYYYEYSPDVQVWIDRRLKIAIECKTYTENAMLKRILVDFTLLKYVHPRCKFVLLQLESQLGGDYAKNAIPKYGSCATHTLLSYFDIDLHILTLLEGERKVDAPIHKSEFYKPLRKERLRTALNLFRNLLSE